MTSNYFKSFNGRFFFFDDSNPSSIEAAWECASLVDAMPAVYRVIGLAGPWDKSKIIGHRRREEILHDLSHETDREEVERLHRELSSLHLCYTEVGRRVPMVLAA